MSLQSWKKDGTAVGLARGNWVILERWFIAGGYRDERSLELGS